MRISQPRIAAQNMLAAFGGALPEDRQYDCGQRSWWAGIWLMVNDSVDLCDGDSVMITIVPPLAASTTPTGAPKYRYRTNEDVYATGSGFATGTNVDIHVVHDRDWNDGDPIPQDVTGAVETVSVNGGDIAPVSIWHAPLVSGRYDIVIDLEPKRRLRCPHRWAGQRITGLCRGC